MAKKQKKSTEAPAVKMNLKEVIKVVKLPKDIKRMVILMGGNTSVFKNLMIEAERETQYQKTIKRHSREKTVDKDLEG